MMHGANHPSRKDNAVSLHSLDLVRTKRPDLVNILFFFHAPVKLTFFFFKVIDAFIKTIYNE